MKKKVVVFGIFDGVHEGHRNFFYQAAQHGDVIAIVGRDRISMQLKNEEPKHSEGERLSFVEKEENVTRAVLGDEELSTYEVLKEISPDIVCLGYDQGELKKDLVKWVETHKEKIELVETKAYKPDIYHSSLLK